jgi:hypothetical protein
VVALAIERQNYQAKKAIEHDTEEVKSAEELHLLRQRTIKRLQADDDDDTL